MKGALQALKALCSIGEHSNEAHVAYLVDFARGQKNTSLTVVVQPQEVKPYAD